MAAVNSPSPGNGRAAAGIVVPHAPTLPQRWMGWLVFTSIRLVAATLRYSYNNQSGYSPRELPSPVIFCAWHNRLALSLIAYYWFARSDQASARLAAMVSASKDGGFLSAILEHFGAQPVRGSTSRRGRQALLELTSWAGRGYDLAITPDGPRGPRYVVQDGVMALAQLTGLPILPFTYNLRWKIQIKSWDRFQIPLPFSSCEMCIGAPIHIPRDATDEQREARRLEVERVLQSLTRD